MISYFHWGGGRHLIQRVFFYLRQVYFRALFRQIRWLIPLIFIALLQVDVMPSKSYDDIFKQVFGRIPEKQYFTQQMALIVDGEFVVDNLQVLVPSVGSDYKVFSYTLLKYLYETQKPGTVRDLTLKIDENGMLSSEDISQLGYKMVIDRRAFKVFLEVPAEYRKKIVYYIMGEPEPISSGSMGLLRDPANLSAYLNYSLSTSFIQSSDAEQTSGMESPMGSFYGISKTGAYSLNYAGSVDMSATQKINLANLNIQKDLGDKNERWTLGQVNPLVKGSQSSISLMGIGYTAGPVLNSIGSFSPQFSHTIDLDKDSVVEIYVNYQKIKTIELSGGVYDLRGFPLRTGFNVVKIVKITNYDVAPPKKDIYVGDGEYNPIDQGAIYQTRPGDGETYMDQAIRLHQVRKNSSEWLMSDKLPRKGQVLSEDLPPPQKVVKTEYVFPFSVDPVLYDPSYFEWNYSMGYPMSWMGFSPVLQDDAFSHSLYVKKGLNNFITATGYTQFNNAHVLLGHEVYMSSPFGPIFMNNALKRTKGVARLGGFSKASFMTYPIYSSPNQWVKLMSFGVSGTVRTPRFLAFGAPRPVLHENLLFTASASVSYQLLHLFSGTFQYSETTSLMGVNDGDVQQYTAIFQRKLPFGFGVSTSYQQSVGQEVIEPKLFTFKVSWSGLDGLGVSAMSKQTVGTKDVQIDSTYQKDFLDNQLNTSTTFHHSLEKKSLGTSLRYGPHSGSFSFVNTELQQDQQFGYILNNQRFSSNVSYLSRQIGGAPTSVLSLSAESAFVYADNHFAISTPIQESFALFSADESLKGRTIYVGEEGRKIDWLGATVLPSLRDRVITDVIIDVPDLSVGAEIDRLHSFRPVNFNAYLVELHVTPSVMLMGKLLRPNKKAARYLRGYVTSPNDSSVNEKLITSRSGIFQVPNLKPGTYILTFGKKPYENIEIDIPSHADGLYRMDHLTLVSKDVSQNKSAQKSALEEQIEEQRRQRKQKKDMQNQVSKIDLLQELINDILAEKQETLDPIAQDVEPKNESALSEVAPVAKPLAYTLFDSESTSVDRANQLHELKKEVNQFLNEQKKEPKPLKDSIALAEKINAYYLSSYEPKKAKNTLFNDQLRTTSEQALLVHKKRRKLNMKSQKWVSSNAIQKALQVHQKRQSN